MSEQNQSQQNQSQPNILKIRGEFLRRYRIALINQAREARGEPPLPMDKPLKDNKS